MAPQRPYDPALPFYKAVLTGNQVNIRSGSFKHGRRWAFIARGASTAIANFFQKVDSPHETTKFRIVIVFLGWIFKIPKSIPPYSVLNSSVNFKTVSCASFFVRKR